MLVPKVIDRTFKTIKNGEELYLGEAQCKAMSEGQNVWVPGATTQNMDIFSWTEIYNLIRDKHTDYFEIGDYKNISLNLNASYFSSMVQGTFRCLVIGVNHNAEYEGNNSVHFTIGQNSEGVNICFMGKQAFTTSTNAGGWMNSNIRSFLNNTFYNVLPSDLQQAITPCIKYTDNVGGSQSIESAVTATEDKIFIASTFEITGTSSYVNNYEQYKQKQYNYYKVLLDKVRYRHYDVETKQVWWTRSPGMLSTDYGVIYSSGGPTSSGVNSYYGIVPCFKISA